MRGAVPNVLVVGSSNTDLVVETPRIPAPGETVVGGALSRVAGGKGANQAVAAARLGADVTLIARLGDDDFGATARASLVREGIRTDYVFPSPNTPSGIALIAVDGRTGENAILVSPGANALLTPADLESAHTAFDRADIVVLSLEVPIETIQLAARMGARRRIPVVLNPAPARTLPPELLADTALLTPNETEARQLCGLSPEDETPLPELAAQLLTMGIAAAIITLGPAGALIATPDSIEHSPSFTVHAVDTVAAGDCFTAALAVEIASGCALRDAVRFANAAAALKVTRFGAQPGLPTRGEVEAFLRG